MDIAIAELIGKPALDKEHKKVGKVSHFYLDETDSHPTWVAVTTGLFGSKETLAPLALAEITDERELVIDADKNMIKDAPSVDPGEELTPSEQELLYQHYRSIIERRQQEVRAKAQREHQTDRGDSRPEHVRQQTEGTADTAGGKAMTRAEEELRVGKETKERDRLRLKKYIETENKSVTLPMTKEEVRLEREPITEENRPSGMSGQGLKETVHEETLHEEVPVVEKRTVPKEQVRLHKDTAGKDETIDDQIRKEKIDLE